MLPQRATFPRKEKMSNIIQINVAAGTFFSIFQGSKLDEIQYFLTLTISYRSKAAVLQ